MSSEKRHSKQSLKIPRSYFFFGIFCVAFTMLLMGVEMANNKFYTNDFLVYYEATADYFKGNNPYINNYGLDTGYFKYAPTTLYFFAPTLLFNFVTAQIIHTFILSLALVASVWILHYLLFHEGESKKRFGLLYAAFGLIAVHLAREFHMGNVNLLLLFLFSTGLWALHKGKTYQVIVFWGIMIVLKPIVILALVPLLLFKEWKLIIGLGGLGVIFFIIPTLFSGADGLIDLWVSWFNAISAHGGYIISQNSLTYLLQFYTGVESSWGASLIFLFLLMVFFAWTKYKRIKVELTEWVILFFAFCPNFFVTDTQHFLLSLPLILLLIKYLIVYNKKWSWILFFIGVFFFSLNSNDLLGKDVTHILDEYGTLGIANLLFILLYCIVKVQLSNANSIKQLNEC